MKTSARTRSGRRSEIFRTAASPLPTATTSMGQVCVGSEYGLRPCHLVQVRQKKKGCALSTPRFITSSSLCCAYHGTILRSPFFFLLLDSFFLSSFVPFCVPSCVTGGSGLAASAGCPAPAAAASVFGAPSAVPAVAP